MFEGKESLPHKAIMVKATRLVWGGVVLPQPSSPPSPLLFFLIFLAVLPTQSLPVSESPFCVNDDSFFSHRQVSSGRDKPIEELQITEGNIKERFLLVKASVSVGPSVGSSVSPSHLDFFLDYVLSLGRVHCSLSFESSQIRNDFHPFLYGKDQSLLNVETYF